MPSAKARFEFCMEKKDDILAMHSSEIATTIFAWRCCFCERYFKRCMFSKAEGKAERPACRWCQVDLDEEYYDIRQFQVGNHIHCNKAGAKTCTPMARLSLEPRKSQAEKTAGQTEKATGQAEETGFVSRRESNGWD